MHTETSCNGRDSTKSYKTLFEAQRKCDEDESCTGVVNQFCDYRKYWICKGTKQPTSSGTCSWWKGKNFYFFCTYSILV